MKRFSMSLVVREIQIKTTIRYHFILIRIVKIKKNLTTLNAGVIGEQLELSFIADGNANSAATLETVQCFP